MKIPFSLLLLSALITLLSECICSIIPSTSEKASDIQGSEIMNSTNSCQEIIDAPVNVNTETVKTLIKKKEMLMI